MYLPAALYYLCSFSGAAPLSVRNRTHRLAWATAKLPPHYIRFRLSSWRLTHLARRTAGSLLPFLNTASQCMPRLCYFNSYPHHRCAVTSAWEQCAWQRLTCRGAAGGMPAHHRASWAAAGWQERAGPPAPDAPCSSTRQGGVALVSKLCGCTCVATGSTPANLSSSSSSSTLHLSAPSRSAPQQ